MFRVAANTGGDLTKMVMGVSQGRRPAIVAVKDRGLSFLPRKGKAPVGQRYTGGVFSARRTRRLWAQGGGIPACGTDYSTVRGASSG
jgi:hypothetical protein